MQEGPKDVIHRLVNREDVAVRTPQRHARIVDMYGETFAKLTFGLVGPAQHQSTININSLGPETNRNVHLWTRILAHDDRLAVCEATFQPTGLAVQICRAVHLLDDAGG